ncbi:RagB/SusD family nutrient uptake outer membrane protein [Salegentibacter maritimus]|uniref:RagB/SusD family nutrient uptake outer membrane protein n=1 Tax=Salegentibacter maritimus TaxID=2794347 RepID=A0ABS0TIG9_9FLAO|nr:RagB/SusD family nutrient uptake outer membrane protein [Salegentibacter maritimus]MBI6120818.1 RagB/SusD family nutrient uptake outer membrane protein [Salegentibacter maritimus]
MKKILLILSALFFFYGCDDDFLNKLPKDELVVKNTFTTYSNFKTYAWDFYNSLPGYDLSVVNSEWNGDLFLRSNDNGMSDWIWQRIIVPTKSENYAGPYNRIRRVNLMLENLESSSLTESEVRHWRSVGYFFRSYEYFNLLQKYGAIPWIEETLSENSEELNAPRTPRNEIAQNILENLLYAEENIKPEGDGPNTIGIHAVRFLLSRFGLFEGTWRKYHNLGNSQNYLQESAIASQKLIQAFPNLYPDYDKLFNSNSLAGVPGIILYHEYNTGVKTHFLTSRMRNSAGNWDLTKKAADKYLMTDGETRWTSPLFSGDQDPYSEFRNRDHRMYYTITPPFKVNSIPDGQNTSKWEFTGDPKDREYIDIMAQLSDDEHKTLPSVNWRGLVVRESPHFRDFNNGQGYNAGFTGYKLFKYYNELLYIQNQDINDKPVFRMGEVLLNYAEAKYELGEFDQAIADQTINRLRERGAVAPLTVGSEPSDPTRDPEVNPTLWEIRRERAVELMGEGFRFDDLRRWKKMKYTQEEKLGRWVDNSKYGDRLDIQNGTQKGYVTIFGKPTGEFPNYYYLYPIPSNELVLNPALEQNPGWGE